MNVPAGTGLYRTTYDRNAVATGIVHAGFGAFHRGHQAVYLDDYMQATGDLRWGVAAVNLRAADSASFAAMGRVQDGYLLKTMAPDGGQAMRLVRSHAAYADWAANREAAESLLERESVHALSMTVTESGYYLASDWTLNTSDPVIAGEIAGKPARSIYAFLANALSRRAERLDQPITVLCCDNIRANGRVLERAFLSYLEATGRRDLADWVESNASFPCSMVDRITPRATAELADEVEQLFPGESLAPIHAETFTQWVIEDRFAGPMPDLGKCGVQIVDDVHPFEEAKIRILNGGHTGLAYLGALAGHRTFDQAMADPDLRAHFDLWQRAEVLPGLTLSLPFDKGAYLAEIAARFGNAAIADQLERICMDGYSKMPIYVRPTLEACLAQGISPRHGYRCIASWYVFARRSADGACRIPYIEPYWDSLKPLLANGQETAFASAPQLWADLPERFPDFVPGVVAAMQEMERQWPV